MALDLTGQTLLGKYEIVSLLGAGGMGAVWRGRHLLTGRKVAIKVLDEGYLANKKIVQRFGREARAASAIQHPGIVEVLDVDQTDGGVPFMVMEFLEGETLASRIERRGRLAQEELLRLGGMLLEALDAAHAKGVIHRDLKPENIYVVPAGRRGELVKILDFGISHMREDDGQKLTMTGSVLGTPHYMSPEQAMGEAEIDQRADLYAAGVVLYECAVGDVPFDAPNYNKLLRLILDEDPTPPRARGAEISAEVERVIHWAMDKDRDRRVSSAREMAEWLERAAAGELAPHGPAPAPAPLLGGAAARPAGTLPANRGIGSTLGTTPLTPADAWRPSLAPTPAEHPSSVPPPAPPPAELEWDLEAALDTRPKLRSTPPPASGSLAVDHDDPLAPTPSLGSLELDERALRPRSVRPPAPVVGQSGPHASVSASSAGAILAPVPSAPPPRPIPPRVSTLSGSFHAAPVDEARSDDDRGGGVKRLLLFGLVGLLAFAGVVGLVRWVVEPGADPESIPVPEAPPVDEPDTTAAVPTWISVRIVGLPPGARITLDGLPASSPLRVRQGGAHEVEITAPGYETRRLSLDADRNRTVHARMRPAEGAIQAP